MPTCGACGEDIPARFRFCGVCGAPVAEQARAQREIRKTVTVLFCDVVDSTRLGARLDPESLRQVMGRYFEVAREALQRHGGIVEKFIGDAVMAVFGVPTLHEDDALRAVRAAADLRQAVREELNGELERNWGVQLAVRIGVNTGPVISGDPASGQTLVTGDAVNVAARLEQVAGSGDILIGSVTWSLVRDAVVAEPATGLTLKGKDEPVQAYRVASVTPNMMGRARRTDTPMVGRERERRLLDQAFERSMAEAGCHLFTVLGPAGVGKSRLVHEFLTEARRQATVVRGRCLDYGDGITFWPLVQIVREVAGVDQSESPERLRVRLAELLGHDEHGELVADRVAALTGGVEVASRAEEVPWAVRKLFESLARRRPLVVVIDDLHWAEPTLLDLVEHVADWSREAPILLLCLARPELLDVRPGWGGGKLNATSILLEPLTPVESATLVGNLLGPVADGETVRARIAAAAEGNPLFVEELVGMLVDEGLLVRREDRWVATTDLATTPIPPNISALLAARLDRLAQQERCVIERASVVGKTFYRAAVAELSPSELRSDVAGSLMALVRKELIRPDRSALLGDDAFRFRHLLIRDAAYDSMPRRERAELHERLADWLEHAAVGRVAQFEEILGHHLEQACRQRRELGMTDEHQLRLATRAARHLAAAGRRAFGLSDVPAALALLERAAEVAPGGDRPRIAADLAEVLLHAGRLHDARSLLDRVSAEIDGPPPPALVLARTELSVTTDPSGLAGYTVEIEQLLPVLEAAGNDQDLARGLHLLARMHWVQGQVLIAEAYTRRAVELARRAGQTRQLNYALTQLAFYTLIGPTPVDEGIDRCQELLAAAGDDRRMRASVLKTLAGLHAMRGEFAHARELGGESLAILEDLGLRLAAAQASVEFAIRELVAGDVLAAEAEARKGFDVLDTMGESSYLSSCAALLAHALSLQGLHHEAGRYAGISERTADPGDVISQFQWRVARARVLAGTGRTADAVRLAQEATEQVAGTDLLSFRGDAHFELALLLREDGRPADALRAAHTALALHERKGNTATRDHVRVLVEELSDEQLATA
ncbi:ATP-binding protein [Blastococcus deserti]|uniref:ATP-binding protein n=1 Tax=Blastococcus deserti TaxID=2259033 RepID=A0ABW4XFZ2_9ACTN